MRQKEGTNFCLCAFFNARQKLVNFFHMHKGKYKLQLRVFNFGMC